MAEGDEAGLPSHDMTALDRPLGGPPAQPASPSAKPSAARAASPTDPDAREVDADSLSLGRRLRQPRTLISILVPLALIVLVVRALPGFELERIPSLIGGANVPILLVAFAVHYSGFPLRGIRWATLLRGTGIRIRFRDSTEILFLSWLVNCLVPAKLGDVYRAYLLKINGPTVSLSRTFGTVFIERILDLFAIATLGLAAGFWSFRDGLPPEIQIVFGIGLGVMLLLAAGLLTMRNFGRRIVVRLPLPHRVVELYDKFEEGVFGAIAARSMPGLLLITGLIWATEGMRLFLVIRALGFEDVQMGISGAFFVAFIASLLTAVPLSPAGLGIVEAGVVGVLTIAYGVPPTEAAAIALVDRAISVFSIVVLGSLAYVVSPLRRGTGLRAERADPKGSSTDRHTPHLSARD